ncbi:hypothetical protein AOA80_06890 [Methanomassiliicoccales archaeon RumEn M1]|nr:hypothetical protein AOA80_06890 [Methanomassiliicoccales archaeon RumEn M1]
MDAGTPIVSARNGRKRSTTSSRAATSPRFLKVMYSRMPFLAGAPLASPLASRLAILLMPWNMLRTAGSISIMLMLMVSALLVQSRSCPGPGASATGTTML